MLARAVTVLGCALVLAATADLPASADGWGTVTCSQSPAPDCQLGAGHGPSGGGTHPQPGSGHRPSSPRQPGHHGSSSPDPGAGGDVVVGGAPNLAHCSYVRSGYHPPTGATTTTATRRRLLRSPDALAALPVRAAGSTSPGGGAWYLWTCTTAGVTDGLYHPPVWIPSGKPTPTAPPTPSPAQLAQAARRQLRLPAPAIAANPTGDQLVNLPTWLWLSHGWARLSATASVPGVSVTAVATPVSVSWTTGDGGTVTCHGPGTPFRAGSDPAAASPDCGHTYHASSANQPGQTYSVTATVHWTVGWSGAGHTGTFPNITTTGDAAFRVAESQALNTNGG